MPQHAVMQHRQVEPGTVPGDERGAQLLEAAEEATDHVLLGAVRGAEAPDLQLVVAAQDRRDRDHAVLLERQERGTGFLSPRGEHLVAHREVVAFEAEPAPEFRVGDRLDVEHEAVGAAAHAPFFIRTAKATTRPASSVRLT